MLWRHDLRECFFELLTSFLSAKLSSGLHEPLELRLVVNLWLRLRLWLSGVGHIVASRQLIV